MAEKDQNDDVMGDITDDDAAQLLAGAAGQDDSKDDAGNKGTEDSVTDSDAYKADIEKWKKLSRQNEKNLRDTQNQLKQYQDKDKTEAQRLQEERDSFRSQAEKNASELQRLQIAGETAPEHATLAQLRKVARRMAGEDTDALEADAKELWADFAPAPTKQPVSGKPRERLRGGSDPDGDDDGELDPAKLAARIPRRH